MHTGIQAHQGSGGASINDGNFAQGRRVAEAPVRRQGPQVAAVFQPEIRRQGIGTDLHEIAVGTELLVVGHGRIKVGEATGARAA